MPEDTSKTTDLFEIICTTRSMRRLKPDPVPNELIRKILEAGVCAPSGGNMQRSSRRSGRCTSAHGTKWLHRDTGLVIPHPAWTGIEFAGWSPPPNI